MANKTMKTPKELSDLLRQQIGAPDSLIINVHPDKLSGWHVTVYGNDPSLVHRTQSAAEAAADQLRLQYDLKEHS